ncbi:hypothetical protein KOR42_32890 [Thalassoglobus neptunius]|uniref:HNH endonuclease n=1 Tax=Thalassoglobus neptunius TaxID=1938619 RepID=A0A5C5WLY9_9PLAN|nr:hypothetical protein KOR42_32890 [Thalassoglobus neptunius]
MSSHERKVEGYKIRRRILTQAMGGKCSQCESTEELEFHHLYQREWVASKTSRWSRQRQYEEEFDNGLLTLLCADCNKRAGKPSSPAPQGEEVPF